MGRAGARLALGFAAAGLVIALAILSVLGLLPLLVSSAPQVGVGLLVLVAVAAAGGARIAPLAASGAGGYAVGAAFAVATVVLATIAGTAVSLLLHGEMTAPAVYDWMVKPLFWVTAVGFLPAVALGLGFGRLARRRVDPRPSRAAAWIALGVLVLPIGVGALGMGREEVITHEMRWLVRDAADRRAGRVTLVFVEHPNHFQTMESFALLEHLEAHGHDTVPVTFRVTRDLWETRGVSLEKIHGWSGDHGWRGGGHGCGEPLPACGAEESAPW